jgi:hypothetical protein
VNATRALVAVTGAVMEDVANLAVEWTVGPVVSWVRWKRTDRALCRGGAMVKTQLLIDMGFIAAEDVGTVEDATSVRLRWFEFTSGEAR